MKRLHIHVSVKDLAESIRFYSGLFATAPTVEKADYAKWLLDDPRVNFAVSTHAQATGVNHLGIQAEDAEELTEIKQRAHIAGIASQPEVGADCCYARSDKHWLEDPQGIVWEAFHTMGDIPVYGANRAPGQDKNACCAPVPSTNASARTSCGTASACG
ncbi:ArsI/CadI family heavy metal resistance metalloenzyme [Pseudoxanthomonas putridarboris]|uniref:ArsI/CadI family heavy metal resistance metalloenzyme n=1 Tax=Pseudoxanthomonas putridarboris TaxID=752605 RepID=A0ABU9J140_9GAMM